ncbi:hypothetical protein HPB52_005652 [Rhipicephalus sanguineus]|uniref:CHHC U11-48K-type domain-containing protein n=1 Tax=Rhipicephalus sanguineus TaxID=34632 RepID=A0A9D4QHS1_RHISA|nr:hypothetical protein HPB52_005652 [Rhipicephalus sanguineus]
MSSFSDDQLGLVQCPYNPEHKVKRSRFDSHVSRCRRQVGRPCLRPCLFNPSHLVPSKATEFYRHLETCPDRSSTLPVPQSREDVESEYVVPVASRASPSVPEPEEQWEVGAPTTSEPRQPPVPPVFRQVHGLSFAERRVHYRSLFANQVDYAPPKQPKDKATCSNQSTHAVREQAEARKPRGAQAASPRTVADGVNWPSCSQASQVQTSHAPTGKSWAQMVAHATDRQPRRTQPNQPCSTKARQVRGAHAKQARGAEAGHLRGAQDSKARRTQARQAGGAQARLPRGAQAGQPRGVQARHSRGAHDSALSGTQDSPLRGTQATQSRGAQADNPRVFHAAQNQRLGGQASATPVQTWADLFRNRTPASGNRDVDGLAESLKGLGSSGPNEQ